MIGKIVLALSTLALVRAQIPSLGFCPEYVPMTNFNMERFLGVWYEAERYFQLTEVVSRCVTANYTQGPDGKFRVSNEVTNRFTGIKRILEGEIKKASSKAEEGKIHVKYTIPLTPETKYSVLDTDYTTYAVLWSCSGIGPFHTQNAWVMTRERLAPGEVLQKAYGVLDKYKISKTFFVKTDQDDCAYLATAPSTAAEIPSNLEPNKPQAVVQEKPGNYRSAVAPDAPQFIIDAKNAERLEKEQPMLSDTPIVENAQTVMETVKTVAERILKVADTMKEEKPAEEPKEEKKAEEMEPSEMKKAEPVESLTRPETSA